MFVACCCKMAGRLCYCAGKELIRISSPSWIVVGVNLRDGEASWIVTCSFVPFCGVVDECQNKTCTPLFVTLTKHQECYTIMFTPSLNNKISVTPVLKPGAPSATPLDRILHPPPAMTSTSTSAALGVPSA